MILTRILLRRAGYLIYDLVLSCHEGREKHDKSLFFNKRSAKNGIKKYNRFWNQEQGISIMTLVLILPYKAGDFDHDPYFDFATP